MKYPVLLLAALTALVVVGGIGAAAHANVVGSYTAQVSGQAPQLNGKWTMKFTTTYAPAGKFQGFRNGKLVVSGTTAFTGNKLTLVDMSGSYACKGSERAGVYSFSLKGKALKFTKVLDLCIGRASLLSNRTFTKK